MNPSPSAIPTQSRVHTGWLWVALALHATGAAAFQLGNDYSSLFESRIDGILRMIVLFGLAVGLTQLSSLVVAHMAGAAIAASMRRRMIVAILVLGLLNLVLGSNTIFRLPLFGLIVGIAWHKWTRLPLVWLGAAAISGLLVHLLNQQSIEILYDLMPSAGILTSRVFYAASLGLIWALVGGTAFAILHTFAPNTDLPEWRRSISELAELIPGGRRLLQGMLAIALLGTLWVVYLHGSQNCRWIDRALGRSGCVGTIATRMLMDPVMAFTQDGSTLLVTDLAGASLYDFASRQRVQALDLPEARYVVAGTIAADGSQIALAVDPLGGSDTTINIYRRAETTPFQSLVLTDTFMPALGFSLDGRSLLIDDTIWSIADGARLGQVDAASRAQYRTTSSLFHHESPDGSFTTRESGAEISIYSPRYDGSIGLKVTTLPTVWPNQLVLAVFSPDNSLLATTPTFDSQSIEIWRTSDGSLISTIPVSSQNSSWIEALAFTADSQHLLVANGFQDSIEIYRLK
ncbi:MAG: WD40 repeat domain-containing protein [Herpetosiphonaceae bacterium]|nr:WD40 repeat domain-containing protein [Herpetosiphonaceae bacterium]